MLARFAVAVSAVSYGADGVSLADSGKSTTDHFASMVSKQDCALWRMFRNQKICRERNVPVIVNLHSLDIARRYCTRVVAMSKGAIVFDGPPAALTQTVLDRVYAGRMTAEASPLSIVEAA